MDVDMSAADFFALDDHAQTLEAALEFLDEYSATTESTQAPPPHSSSSSAPRVSLCSASPAAWSVSLPTTPSASTPPCAGSTTASASSPLSSTDSSASDTLPRAASRASGTTASTAQRKRPREELLQLREHVAELQARLAHLQRFCVARAAGSRKKATATAAATKRRQHDSATGSTAPTQAQAAAVAAISSATTPATRSVWFRRAVAEYERLERAKQWNFALRREMAAQRRTGDALEQLFALQLSSEDVVFLAEVEAQSAAAPHQLALDVAAAAAAFTEDAEFAALYQYLEDMYARTSAVLAQIALHNAQSEFETVHSLADPVRGRSLEVLSNAPLSHGFRAVERFLWQQLAVNIRFGCGNPSHERLTVSSTNFFTKRLAMVLSSDSERRRSVDTAVVVRRFVEARRVVIAIISRLRVTGCSLVFRKAEYIVVTDLSGEQSLSPPAASSTAAAPSSLLQTHIRAYSEHEGDAQQTLPQDVAALRNVLMDYVSTNLQANKHRLQQVLLEAPDADFLEQRHRELALGCLACRLQALGQQVTSS